MNPVAMSVENEIRIFPTDSEYESDVSSINDYSTINLNENRLTDEHLINRLDSLTQENRVLKIELQTFKLRLKAVDNEIKQLKHESVSRQAKAEQEEEFISNTLFKKIKELKKEKETLANNFEREEEFLTNDLTRKLQQIREEKQSLEKSLEKEQSSQINHLMKRIQRLEAETTSKQNILEQLRKEKIDLENTLEKEQESLVNRLWKRMEKLETDKKLLMTQIDEPRLESKVEERSSDDAEPLKKEIEKLRRELALAEENHRKNIEEIRLQEKNARNENLRLQRKLQLEIDRREELYRQWSESESSLEMDEERALNQKMKHFQKKTSASQGNSSCSLKNFVRCRTSSSPSFLVQQHNESLVDLHQRKSLTSNSFDRNNQIQ